MQACTYLKHTAQTGLAQHWLAGLLTVDPSSNAGPGTSSVTTTNHIPERDTLSIRGFPHAKGH